MGGLGLGLIGWRGSDCMSKSVRTQDSRDKPHQAIVQQSHEKGRPPRTYVIIWDGLDDISSAAKRELVGENEL